MSSAIEQPPPSSPAPAQSVTPPGSGVKRIMAIDALRGFDMFWILGADAFVRGLEKINGGPIVAGLAAQLEHKDWRGFGFYDLIFPLFVFIVGVSLVFSLTKSLEQTGPAVTRRKIFRRFVLLFLLALIYSGGVAREWPEIRLLGVLNRIALCYLFAALIFCRFRAQWKAIAGICAALLIGYWVAMTFVPFPDVRPGGANGQAVTGGLAVNRVDQLNFNSTHKLRGVFEPGLNLAHYLDQKYLPGKKWDGTWDPEGLLSTIPAIGTCLLGVLAGLLLQNKSISDARKVQTLAVAGVLLVIAGFAWGLQFPVIKKIWTSSYVLVAGGYSALLLALFYQIIEIWQVQRWAKAFVWIGANAITLYMANNIIDFRGLAARFAGGDVKNFFNDSLTNGVGDLVIAAVSVTLAILLGRFLYQRKIFLRI
ncbi:MAG TPA: heparan-alpha-glucosaminide N-acetyltransferase domain-containing protein [Verrucomicrobiae bacterium]|nr:heparan-alpha-glucosaminide N-acetyltransferase domain-containing protein [Verrucomicrobiae bacterium]